MLRQPMLLVMICAAAAALQTPVASEVLEIREETLESFTWVEKGANDTLRVCFSWSEDKKHSSADVRASHDPTSPFQLTYSTVDDTIISVYSSDVPECDGTTCCGDVPMDISTLDYNANNTYMVNSEEVHAVAEFRMSIEPGILYAENLAVINETRVGGMTDYAIENCQRDETAHCFLSSNEFQGMLCTQSVDTFTENDIAVCDSTVHVIQVNDATSLKEVVLSYDNDTVEVKHESADSTLQIMICDDSGCDPSACEGSRCYVTESPGTSVYTLVIVEVYSNSSAKSSDRIQVQDLNVTSMGLSLDAVGVRWGGPEDANYTVTVDRETQPETRKVNCMKCAELFIGHTSPQSVEIKDESSLTRVVASVSDMKFKNVPGGVSELDHTVRASNPKNLTSKVCVATDLISEPSILAILSDQNKTYSTTSFDENKCATLQMETPSGIVRVLVTGYSGNESFSTQVDLNYFLPQLQRRTGTSALASWENLNHALSYKMASPAAGGSLSDLQCITGKSCRYYVSATDEKSTSFSLVENAEVVQNATIILEQTVIEELVIDSKLRTRYDDHLLVCYEAGTTSSATQYELGMEREGTLVVSDTNPQKDDSSDELCLITSEAVLLGAYVKLWTVVAELDSEGNVQRSGEQMYEDLYLSVDAGVYALVAANNRSFDLRSSWKLVDDTAKLNNYTVSLSTEKGQLVQGPFVVPIYQTTYTFEGVSENLYVVNVVVHANDISSENVQSDVIHASSPTDPEDIPETEKPEALITDDNSVKISWEVSDEELEGVTAFLIEYDEKSSKRKKRAVERTPLSRAGTLQHSVQSKAASGKSGFRIVPVSQTTAELSLDPGTWTICVSAMMGSQAGQSQCGDADVVSGDTYEVLPPENVKFDETTKLLSWSAPSDSSGSEVSYYIEAQRSAALKNTKVEDVSVDLSAFLGSGEWTVSVQTVQDSHLSVEVQLVVTINGIEITVEQTGNREMLVAWSESVDEPSDTVSTSYTVTFLNTADLVGCMSDCFQYYLVPDQSAEEPLYITVKNDDTDVKTKVEFYFVDIPSVSQLKSSYKSKGNSSISWTCVEDAACYNVTLYDESGNRKYSDVPVSCSYIFEDVDVVPEDEAVVQACTVKSSSKHPTRCGDPQNIDIQTPSEDDSSNTLVIVLSSIVGVLVIAAIVGLVIVFTKPGKKKQPPKSEQTTDVELQETAVPIAPENEDSPPLESGDNSAPRAQEGENNDHSAPVAVNTITYGRQRSPPPPGPHPLSYSGHPPRPYPAPQPDMVPNRFSTVRRPRRPQSLSPVRQSRRSNYEAQQAPHRHRSPYSSQPPMSPNQRGPAPRPAPRPAPHPAPRPAPRSRSFDRADRPPYPKPRPTSYRPPRPYSSGPRPNVNMDRPPVPPVSGQSRNRY